MTKGGLPVLRMILHRLLHVTRKSANVKLSFSEACKVESVVAHSNQSVSYRKVIEVAVQQHNGFRVHLTGCVVFRVTTV